MASIDSRHMVAFVERCSPYPNRSGLAVKRERLLELLRSRAFQEREVMLSSGSDLQLLHRLQAGQPRCRGRRPDRRAVPRRRSRRSRPQAVAVGGLTLGADPLATATSIVELPRRPAARGVPRAQGAQGPRHQPVGREHPAAAPAPRSSSSRTSSPPGAATLKAIERARLAGLARGARARAGRSPRGRARGGDPRGPADHAVHAARLPARLPASLIMRRAGIIWGRHTAVAAVAALATLASAATVLVL